jgi:nuclear pore complex protein Nup133
LGLTADLDEELDTINVHDTLREQLISAVPSRRNAPPSMQSYVDQYAKNLVDRPTFRKLFVNNAQRLVYGTALSIEDLVDVLTMKENGGDAGARDPVIALERLLRDVVSVSRASASARISR